MPPRTKSWIAVGLLIVVVLVGLVRWRFLETPLERDKGEFGYGGQRLLAGDVPIGMVQVIGNRQRIAVLAACGHHVAGGAGVVFDLDVCGHLFCSEL